MDDLELLCTWRRRRHVREWWDDDDPYDDKEFNDRRVKRWIIEINGRPFAYMQDYDVHGWCKHHLDYLPTGSRGIDQYIGEPDMIGRGHGPAFIMQRLNALFDDYIPAVGTDPSPNNTRAIAAYKKAGLRVSGPEQDTEWGVILPMEIRRP
ncbi:MAG: GNAT family N-acetyltransferase [Hyphomicrobiaceae bacterium]